MKRYGLPALALWAIVSASGGAALAEAAGEEVDSCPTGAVSVYFPSGDVSASDASLDLIGRVGGLADACRADTVDLVAWVDPREGDNAFALALERLKLVSYQLVEFGLSADRMRVAARVQTGQEVFGPGARNVRIILHNAGELSRAEAPKPTRPATSPLRLNEI